MLCRLLLLITLLLLPGCEQFPKPVQSQRHSAIGLYDASISLDGRFALVASVNHAAGYWDLEQQSLLFNWDHGKDNDDEIVSTALSPDGGIAATAGMRNFALWNTKSGKSLNYIELAEDIRDIALSNRGLHIALALGNHTILYLNMKSGKRLEITGHGEVVNAIALSANGRYLLTCGNDYRAILWDIQSTIKPLYIWEHENRVTQVALSQGGELAFSSGVKGDAFVWDLKSGLQRARLKLNKREYTISQAQFSKDSRYLVTGTAGRNLMLWDSLSGEKLDQWQVSTRDTGKPTGAIVYGLGFSPDGQHVLSEASSGYGEKWKIEKRLTR